MHNLHNNFPGGLVKAAEGYHYFLPADIFKSRDLTLNLALTVQVEEASLALGRFSSLIDKLPKPTQAIKAYKNKESMLSSRIEGTQAGIEETFVSEMDIEPEKREDWEELNAYIRALDQAIEQLKKLPLCKRLIKDTHKVLLSQVRGKDKLPGQFRRSQNWIGGSRPDNAKFVPPLPMYVDEAMDNLEMFIQDDKVIMPHLIKSALIHFQFEVIHPFLDGNGRIGRMLISLYLLEKKVIKQPILFLSAFFERNRQNYIDALHAATSQPDGLIKWISFFLDGVYQTAEEGSASTQKILDLSEQKHDKFKNLTKNGRRLLNLLFDMPVINTKQVEQELQISHSSAPRLVKEFEKRGILKETTGKKTNRRFVFSDYMNILESKYNE